MTMRFPHPLVLLLGGVAVAAALTWALPAGVYDRREDPATRRQIVVAGTYHRVAPTPVGPFAAVVAVPRGLVDAAEVVAVVLLVGGAWVVVDRLGTLGRLVAALAGRFQGRGLIAIPVVSLFFAVMGGLENMQEEIIPIVPVLLLLGRGLGVDAVTVVAMSAGAAMIGSAFGPTNPFQAGIAMKLAQLPALSAGGLRLSMFIAAFVLWVGWTLQHAAKTRRSPSNGALRPSQGVPSLPRDGTSEPRPSTNSARTESTEGRNVGTIEPRLGKDLAIFLLVLSPMAAYVYGAIALNWGFNELSAGFFIAGYAAGLIGGLGITGTTTAYLEGMQSLLPAAMLVGVARSISAVLGDGRVIDTILHGLAAPLSHAAATSAALLMIPFHVLIHVVVPSVSGHAVLTMPLLVPLSDLLGISRQVTVIAYQVGAGLTELLTPTNGALMAVLLAAGVSYQRWMRFALVGAGLGLIVGIAGMLVAMGMR
jgi:uncharacterized ion transporter superfamily protein YfcC